MLAASAAFVAWLGASAIVLADGRRGLALGLGLVAIGLGVIAWQDADGPSAAIVVAGGLAAAGLRLRSGPAGWDVMPAGSTPRLILCVASGLVALWFAASVSFGIGGATRFATLTIVGQAGARALFSREPATVMTAVAAMALAIAVGSSVGAGTPGPLSFVVGALIAAGVTAVPQPAADDS